MLRKVLLLLLGGAILMATGCREENAAAPDLNRVAVPVFEPPPGTYYSAIEVRLDCATPGAEIWYSTNGLDPGLSILRYDPEHPIELMTTTLLKAKAYKKGMDKSGIASASYVIDLDDVATPVMSPPGGEYDTVLNVDLSCETEGALIRYTIDGSDPTAMSDLYEEGSPIYVWTTMTIKARGYLLGLDPSAIASETYILDIEQVDAPVFTPPPGAYSGDIDVAISCGTPGARVYYTRDGSEPTETSNQYMPGDLIHISSSTRLRARGFSAGMAPSTITDGLYLIMPGLLAYLSFDGNALDKSEYGNDGTVHGAMLVSDRNGTPASAYRFDGEEDYIELANESNFDLREFTMVFIAKMNELPFVPPQETVGRGAVITKGNIYGNYHIAFSRLLGEQYAQITYSHSATYGNQVIWCYKQLTPGVYYHVAIAKSYYYGLAIYINGVKESASSNWAWVANYTDTPLMIGRCASSLYPDYFEGVIDDVKIFNRALTASEIAKLYNTEM